MSGNDELRGERPDEVDRATTDSGGAAEEAPVPALAGLYQDVAPRPELEEDVVADLRTRGLLATSSPERALGAQRPSPRSGWTRRWPLRAAAGLLLFLTGWTTRGAIYPTAAPPDISGPEDYMVLVYGEPDGVRSIDPAQVATEYEAWGRTLVEEGVAVTGNELALDRIVLGDPTPAPTANTLGGYFLLSVPQGVEVESLVEGHPHLRYGGWIEIAPILRRN